MHGRRYGRPGGPAASSANFQMPVGGGMDCWPPARRTGSTRTPPPSTVKKITGDLCVLPD